MPQSLPRSPRSAAVALPSRRHEAGGCPRRPRAGALPGACNRPRSPGRWTARALEASSSLRLRWSCASGAWSRNVMETRPARAWARSWTQRGASGGSASIVTACAEGEPALSPRPLDSVHGREGELPHAEQELGQRPNEDQVGDQPPATRERGPRHWSPRSPCPPPQTRRYRRQTPSATRERHDGPASQQPWSCAVA